MDFALSPEQQALEQRVRQFADCEIAPHIVRLEEDLPFRKELFKKMALEGLFLLTVPKERGGTKVDSIAHALAMKAIAKVDAGIAVAFGVTNMVAEAIDRYGTDEQREKYIPAIAKGECVPLSFALTEKEAGSDVKNIKTVAKEDPAHLDSLILDGEKQFITNADISGLIVLIAKGPRGATAYLIEQGTPGFSVVKTERKLGLLTANLVDLKLEGCRISKRQILGPEGDGLKIALGALDSGRIGIASQSLGISEAAYEAALAYSQEREQFGRPLCDNQVIAFKLADMKVKIAAGLLLLYKASWLKQQGAPFTLEASEAKLYCSETCNEIASDALQIFGGYGYVKGYPAERYFRDARATPLYEGTSEVQRIVISRACLGVR